MLSAHPPRYSEHSKLSYHDSVHVSTRSLRKKSGGEREKTNGETVKIPLQSILVHAFFAMAVVS